MSIKSELGSREQLAERMQKCLVDFPGFPRAGIVFKDICPLLADPHLFEDTVNALAEGASQTKAQAIVGIESRGFLFGTPLALKLGLPFIPARKRGKLPGDLVRAEYALEYGTDVIELQRDAIESHRNHFIIDDVLATGGTARAVAECISKAHGIVCGFGFVIEIKPLEGAAALTRAYPSAPVQSLLAN